MQHRMGQQVFKQGVNQRLILHIVKVERAIALPERSGIPSCRYSGE